MTNENYHHDLEIKNSKLQKAISENDLEAVVSIYKNQADIDLQIGEKKSAYFLMTQAYIYALEGGFSVANDLQKTLVLAGKDTF